MRRIVITGLGVTAPIGTRKEIFFNALVQGVSGIDYITLFDAAMLPVRIAGEVKNIDKAYIENSYPETRGIIDRKVLLGLTAFDEALVNSRLTGSDLENKNTGINFGVCLEVLKIDELPGAISNNKILLSKFTSEFLRNEINLQTPLDTTNRIIINKYKINGPDFVNCSACAASTQAIGHSFSIIKRGEAEIMICGGFDSMIHPLGVGGFSLLGALSTRNELRGRACQPFDAQRDGAVLGEGAAIFVLEELSHAQKRHAKIYCEVAGFGSSLDAYKVTDPDPDGEGAAMAMRMALHSASIHPEKIDYINAHGTSTPKNDEVETKAIKNVFGHKAYTIPISSTKSMIGHLIAASGAVESCACICAFERNTIPPTINYEKPDAYCDLDYVPNEARKWNGHYILKNSFGFGGQNACLIFKRWKDH